MNTSRLFYRTRQFWQAISTRSSQVDLELITSILTPSQMSLFNQMQASEQVHSLMVFRILTSQEEQNTDLLVAALLHDVGKIRAPLRLWERVLIVLVRVICPGCIHKWGSAPSEGSLGWRRTFVVAEQHPQWGAELAAQCGTSALAVELISRHQEQLTPSQGSGSSMEDSLLRKLQAVDNNS